MSSLSTVRRMRGIFAGNNKKSATKTPKPTLTSLNLTNDTPQAIVNFLKKSSKCPSFRRWRPNYEIAIHRLAKANHFSGIEEVIEHLKHYPEIRDESFVAGLIRLYGKAKMYDHARKLFDEMPQLDCPPRSVYSFNALLTSCITSERYDKIGGLFRELPEKLSIEPNLMSYNLAMKALCKVGSLDSAVLLMDEIEKHGIKPDIVTCNTLLSAFYESGLSEAENLWIMMEKKNIVPDICSHNIRLRGSIKVNGVSKALQFFEEIINKGLKPNKFIYNTMIKMYVDEGNLDQAKMWKAIDSQVLVYRAIMQRVVDGLVEHSMIENAKELVKLAKSCERFRYRLSLPLHD
ncbi:small ribosomal subunit protein mS79 (rPPR3b)-like [Lycium barbarum]|uniref:small ribosomal subunit protein mS79 (rPPR3b)-like n=1 Tax=Lycium barbarum TaxID=112863 RepID=UPI00293EF399|nr:small ribosomal subunit protein mS79 (rPPR3b)-like [Lycium barbarum]